MLSCLIVDGIISRIFIFSMFFYDIESIDIQLAV